MSPANIALPKSPVDDQNLADLVEEVTRQLEAGHPVEFEALARQHPQYALRLQELWPVLQTVTAWTAPQSDPSMPSTGASHSPLQMSAQLGDYHLLREIGRGGMGTVYEAEQVSLDRKVAVKVLMYAGLLDRRQLERFQNEVRVASRLQHQNIVPVYGVGCDRGVHYYAMQYVAGCTLADVVRNLRELKEPIPRVEPANETVALAGLSTKGPVDGRMYFEAVARLGIQAAEAIEYAHSQGIVHRDIKPANMLVEANGHLWITDFGLARMEANAGVTATGDVLGTLRYMSPEQAEGRNALVDERTDIYSLGATIYELLTLYPAFADGSRQEILQRIVHEEPQRPRRVQAAVPVDLETIVLKAMEKSLLDRYASAAELASDLRRYLENRPIRAQRPTAITIAQKWCRRHRRSLLSTAGLVFLMALAVTALLARERQRIVAAWSESERHRQHAIASLRLAKHAVNDMYSDVAQNWLDDQPNLQQKQKEFLTKAAQFYDQLLQEPMEEPRDRFEAAQIHMRLANIKFALDETFPVSEYYIAAQSALEPLMQEFPDEADYVAAYVECVTRRMKFEQDPVARLALVCAAEQVIIRFAPRHPNHSEVLAKEAAFYLNMRRFLRDPIEQRRYREAATTIAESLATRFPSEVKHRTLLAGCLFCTAADSSDHDEARSLYQRAIEIMRGVAAIDAHGKENLINLTYALMNLGLLDSTEDNKPEDAVPLMDEAATILIELHHRFPDITQYTSELGNTCASLCDICTNFDNAIGERAMAIEQRIFDTGVQTSEVINRLRLSYAILADRVAASGDNAKAKALYDKACRVLDDVPQPASGPSNMEFGPTGSQAIQAGVRAHFLFGCLLEHSLHDRLGAEKEWHAGLLLAADPPFHADELSPNNQDAMQKTVFPMRVFLAQLYAFDGADSPWGGSPQQVVELTREAMSDGRSIIDSLPDPNGAYAVSAKSYLAMAYLLHSSALTAIGTDLKAARESFEETRRLLRGIVHEDPHGSFGVVTLCGIQVLTPFEGFADLSEALALAQQLTKDGESKKEFEGDEGNFIEAWGDLGWALYRHDRLAEAEKAFDQYLTREKEIPSDRAFNLGAAIVKFQLGKHDEARTIYEEALSHLNTRPWLHSWQRVALEEAQAIFEP